MLNRMQQTIQRHANGRTVLVLLGLLAAGIIILNFTNILFSSRVLEAQTGGLSILDFRASYYTPDEAYTLFEALGAEGRKHYFYLLLADFLLPLVGMLFGATCIAWLMRRTVAPHHPTRRLILLPFLLLGVDYAENVSILTMLSAFPGRFDIAAQMAYAFTMLKGIAGIIVVTVIVVCAVILVWPRRSSLA